MRRQPWHMSFRVSEIGRSSPTRVKKNSGDHRAHSPTPASELAAKPTLQSLTPGQTLHDHHRSLVGRPLGSRHASRMCMGATRRMIKPLRCRRAIAMRQRLYQEVWISMLASPMDDCSPKVEVLGERSGVSVG